MSATEDTPQPEAEGAHSLHRIVSLREQIETSLHHWKRILEDAEEFRGPKQVANAKEQIVWMCGYLRALDDVLQANSQSAAFFQPKKSS